MLRAVLGALTFVVASALASVAATVGTEALGLSGAAAKAVPAVVLGVLVVGLVVLLRRRLDRLPLAGMGVRRPGAALTGSLVVGLSAATVFGVDAAAGGIRIVQLDVAALVGFLLVNTLLAVALEALPEEFALRGYSYSALAQRWRPWIAGAGTTALFVLAPAGGIALAAGIGRLAGLATAPATFAPGGQYPVGYAVLLAVFGTMLVTARVSTGSVWASVGAHLTFLTVNRILVAPAGFDTGVRVELPPGGEVLVLGYLLVATVAFAALGRLRRRRRDPAERSGETVADGLAYRSDRAATDARGVRS